MQSRRLFDIIVMKADYWVVVSVVSTGVLGPSLPKCFPAEWLLHIQAESGPLSCRTSHFPLFNFMSFLLAFFYKLLSALWIVAQPSGVQRCTQYPAKFPATLAIGLLSACQAPQLPSAAVSSYSIRPCISNLQILPMPKRDTWSPGSALLLAPQCHS